MASTEEKEKQERLVFALNVLPDKASERRVLLLVESIRAFAGSLSQAPIWCFALDNEKELSETAKGRFSALNTTLIHFKADTKIPRFPFMRKAFVGARAESMAQGKTALLVWLDSDTVVLQEPKGFLLQDAKSLGCRPVHHTVIGSRYDGPLDLFWTHIYRYCKVPEYRVFPMTAHVDGVQIRPYFNAGLLVVRPEKRLLQIWREVFLKLYNNGDFQKFYEKDERYTVFMHQAVLTGTVLSDLRHDEIEILPPTYNYPLHLIGEDVTGNRPSCLEELVTFRYEGFFERLGWRERIPAKEPLKRWIAERLL